MKEDKLEEFFVALEELRPENKMVVVGTHEDHVDARLDLKLIEDLYNNLCSINCHRASGRLDCGTPLPSTAARLHSINHGPKTTLHHSRPHTY